MRCNPISKVRPAIYRIFHWLTQANPAAIEAARLPLEAAPTKATSEKWRGFLDLREPENLAGVSVSLCGFHACTTPPHLLSCHVVYLKRLVANCGTGTLPSIFESQASPSLFSRSVLPVNRSAVTNFFFERDTCVAVAVGNRSRVCHSFCSNHRLPTQIHSHML